MPDDPGSILSVRAALTADERCAFDRNFEANKLLMSTKREPANTALLLECLEIAVRDLGTAYATLAVCRSTPAPAPVATCSATTWRPQALTAPRTPKPSRGNA